MNTSVIVYARLRNHKLVSDSAKTTNWDALGPTIIIDGRIAGTWTSAVEKDDLTITLNPSRPLKQREKLAIAAAAEQYRAFLKCSTIAYGNCKFSVSSRFM